jgi:hypothetical protein
VIWDVLALETAMWNVTTGLELRPLCAAPIRGAFPPTGKSGLWRRACRFTQHFGPAAWRRTMIGRNGVNPATVRDKMLRRAGPMR